MAAEHLVSDFTYEWTPFTVDGTHLTFAQHGSTRLEASRCSHWGPAVYKWEGVVSSGPNAGRVGVLIGETEDLRHRIKQYLTGTQRRGNRLWRDTFLWRGDVRLWVLRLHAFALTLGGRSHAVAADDFFHGSNRRLVVEQLLVMRAVHETHDNAWVVNARQ